MKIRIIQYITVLAFILSPVVYAQELAEVTVGSKEMVVTANPLATAAGEKILKQGGTAADAMVAVQTVLSLVEPQSSGIGGGAFIVYYDAKNNVTTTIDAREKAPSAAGEDRFSGLGFFDAWQSGLSVGVPGVPRMMEYMHQEYGRKPWHKLFDSAIYLAENGYELTERTSSQVAGLLSINTSCEDRLFFRDPTALEYFANPEDCTPKPAGTMITNQDYADTLRTLIAGGANAFYTGPIAADIAAAVQGDPNIAGDMTIGDLANYQIVVREPVCIEYRGHNVCGMGPPSSGALAVGQILGILENFDISAGGPLDAETVHLFAQAGRLAFADRNKYVGDPDFITVPTEGMLDKEYLESRAELITDVDMGTASPGVPPGEFDPYAPDTSVAEAGTSHVSIRDRYGNALSMTTTVEASFGNGVMVRGFLLNNELTDFAFNPVLNEIPVANRVQANKRPRSSMSPTIVFDENGQVEIVTGSPGGSRIIGYTAQSVMNIIDFGLDPQEAINVPHFMNRNGSTDIEDPIPGVTQDYNAVALSDTLKNDFGYSTVNIRSLTSGLSIIQILNDAPPSNGNNNNKLIKKAILAGGADKRRDGTVGGR